MAGLWASASAKCSTQRLPHRLVDSTDHFVANTVNTAATANIADTEHPNTDRSKGHRTAREDSG